MKAIYGAELSQQQKLLQIEQAFNNAFPGSGDEAVVPSSSWYPWIVATFDDLLIVEVNGRYYKVTYQQGEPMTFAPFVDWEEVEKREEWTTKSLMRRIKAAGVKAVGDWELEVLGVPFGSPTDKDRHREYFDANTKLHMDRYPNPAVHYYHGFNPDGTPQGMPEEIGEVQSTEVREDGVWYRVILDKASAFAKRVMDAAKKGLARASSGSAEHLYRVSPDGHIDNWPLIELSIFDMDESEGRRPANSYAVAIPVMKALFDRAGISYPDNLTRSEAQARGEQQRAAAVSRSKLRARLYMLED